MMKLYIVILLILNLTVMNYAVGTLGTFEGTCSLPINNSVLNSAYSQSITLITPERGNPYGPIKGLPATFSVSLLANVSNDTYSKLNNMFIAAELSCFTISTQQWGGGTSGFIWFYPPTNPFIVRDYGTYKTIQFNIKQNVNIPNDADYCSLLTFRILGYGTNKSNQTCIAQVAGLTSAIMVPDTTNRDWYTIDLPTYNSWKSSQDQNLLNEILIGVGLISAIAAMIAAWANWKSAKLSEQQMKEFLKNKDPRLSICPELGYKNDPSNIYLVLDDLTKEVEKIAKSLDELTNTYTKKKQAKK